MAEVTFKANVGEPQTTIASNGKTLWYSVTKEEGPSTKSNDFRVGFETSQEFEPKTSEILFPDVDTTVEQDGNIYHLEK